MDCRVALLRSGRSAVRGGAMIRTSETSPFFAADGIHNLRYYGGYGAADGARVRRGLLYRSGQHRDASDADLELIDRLDIRTIVDLRGVSEREGFPCRRHPEFAAEVIAHDGETSN